MSFNHQNGSLFSDLFPTSEDALSCPKCGGVCCKKTRRKGALERGPLSWMRLRPVRCRECNVRFYAWEKDLPETVARKQIVTNSQADEELKKIVEQMKKAEESHS